jgi:flavin reductase (DIM6/NTAB) family NADH-FMN oxidoreductase RutF
VARVRIDNNVFLPMPVVLVGATVQGKANFMAAGWMTRVNFDPPLIGVSLDATHHTSAGIELNGTFSLCFPSRDLVAETDYCGLVSGKEKDKSNVFTVFYGETDTAPLAEECPLCVECRLVKTVELPGDNLYIGEVVAVFAEEEMLSKGAPDANKMGLFFLTMPDNNYWVLGEKVADAYSVGADLMERA